jgi:hypothetical protein
MHRAHFFEMTEPLLDSNLFRFHELMLLPLRFVGVNLSDGLTIRDAGLPFVLEILGFTIISDLS